MFVRGIRGAITTDGNTEAEILRVTKELLSTLISKNEIKIDNIASIFFSVTTDLTATFPAKAAREMGMTNTPLLCLNEINVPGGLTKCIRVLLHVNTDKAQIDIRHIYLRDATLLRPDQSLPV